MSSITPSFVHAFATFSRKLHRKTYNRSQILKKDVIWNLLNTSQIVMDSVHIRFLQLPSGCWMLPCKAYFKSAGCSFELKNQGTTQNTEKLTGFPSDQER